MAALKYCCCCCEIKTGVLIIAILGWIFTLIKIFGLVNIANEYNRTTAPVSTLEKVINQGLYDEYSNSVDNQLLSGVDTFVNQVLGFQIGYALISLTVCILLVVGVAKKNRYYLLPWMIISFIEYLLFSIATIIGFGILIGITANSFVGLPIFFFILFLFISAFCWYLWVVVQSYYVHLKEERLNEQVLIPVYEN